MTLRTALLFVLGSGSLFTILGGLLGGLLGMLVPGYFRTVFGAERDVDPVALGIGLGVVQGFIGGVFVALVLMALLIWREIRFNPNREPPS
jgi:hypothetical protein